MSASPLEFLKAGPPPARVALLPDGVFFSRAIPVSGAATRAEVLSQVEIALEALSPFPLAQLYFGYFWKEGAESALAYAAYRRRFTTEQLEQWASAEFVLPAFASVLGSDGAPGTTVVLSTPEGFTAVHWKTGPVPSSVLHQPVAQGATDAERAEARERLIRSSGESLRTVDIDAAPVPKSGIGDRDLDFEAGSLRSHLPAQVAEALDVRDKGDLEALARSRQRDVILWRTTIGAVAACLLFLVGELSLVGFGLWQKTRLARVAAQKPTVARIMDEQELAGRIDELSTKRLLPLEMISAASPAVVLPKTQTAIQFLRANAGSLGTLQIEAQTTNAGEIAGYKTGLEQTPSVDHVEIKDQRARDNVVTFTLIVTFKPGALSPATS
jgi:hypothetical protein